MTANFLVEIVKNLFGISQTSTAADSEGAGESDTTITVEREPDESEATETAETQSAEEDVAESDEPADEPTEEAVLDSDPVGEINGIGPTYSDRLVDIGIETVTDIADSDAETVAEAAQVSESRASDWIEQAQNW